MSIIKYSIGGPIISVEDKNSIEQRESTQNMLEDSTRLITCTKCGLQHLIKTNEVVDCSCGNALQFN